MAAIAPNASWHYVMMGIKGASLASDKYASPLVGIRQTSFEDGNEITTETDEGHTGVSNIDMGSYRTKAESSPSWEDKWRYGEGLEDYFYLLLGNDESDTYNDGTNDVDGVFTHSFSMPANNTTELPLATIYNGFCKTQYDGRAFNNALLNELEVSMSADEAPTIKPTFVTDYNNFNLKNPSRSFATESHFAKAINTQVYVGAVGATKEEMLAVPIDCFTEASLTINNNAESQSCHSDDFGKNTKIMGAREATGSITMPWVDGTKYFETEYEAFNKYGHIVNEEITHKQIWFVASGGNIQIEDDSDSTPVMVDSDVPYQCWIKMPDCELTNVTSTKSGSEAKDLTMEFKVLEKPSQSYMTVDMVTDLENLHIDTTGKTLTELRPMVSPFPTS